MAPIQQAPEILLAQRLASNEKPTRTKAIKKLRKYISLRSQNIKGGFSEEELLKLWKGLFYCLWMQDKPNLQEENSNQIAGLMKSFQNVDSQFLFLQTFLQTIKREWTGIDRLRMDKFFQLVRFVFRQTFEMMKRKDWETSVVARFLELLNTQVLHSASSAPCGLQFHILDLYMTELAAMGSAQLTAEQNLKFIDPFCKTAARTKDSILLKAICTSIFNAIIDQAPFAIEDLMKELKAAGGEDSDSGQASQEEEEEEETKKSKPAGKKAQKKTPAKQTNGTTLTEEEEEDDDDDVDEELLHLEDDSDSEMPDDGMGPVLQFDYSALADRLFQLASRSNTPSLNRQRLYKVIKSLRDLCDGVFPQDEYPEEVSTDEDDDEMFGSRTRMKRGRGLGDEEEEEGGPAAKKKKGKKEGSKQGKKEGSKPGKPSDATGDDAKKKKKKRKKKKKKAGEVKEEQTVVTVGSEVKASVVVSEAEPDAASTPTDGEEADLPPATEATPQTDCTEAGEPEAKVDAQASPVEVTETAAVTAIETETQSEIPEPTEIIVARSQSSVSVAEPESQAEPEGVEMDQSESGASTQDVDNQSETPLPGDAPSKKKKGGKKSEPSVEASEAAGDQPASDTQEGEAAEGAAQSETVPLTTTTTPAAKKKPRRKSGKLQEPEEKTVEEAETQPEVEAESTETEEPPAEETTATPLKKKPRRKSAKLQEPEEKTVEEAETQPEVEAGSTEAEEPPTEKTTATPRKMTKRKKAKQTPETTEEEVAETDATTTDVTPAEETPADASIAATPLKKTTRRKKIKQTPEETTEEEGAGTDATPVESEPTEATPAEETPADVSIAATPLKKTTRRKKIKQTPEETTEEEGAGTDATPVESEPTEATPAEEAPADVSIAATPLKKRKKKLKVAKTEAEEVVEGATLPEADAACTEEQPPEASLETPLKKKKKKTKAVVQEEEVEAQTEPETPAVDEPADSELPTPLKKGKKKKRKIEVVIEVEAEELEAAAEKAALINGLVEEQTGGKKKPKIVNDVEEPSTPISSKKVAKKAKAGVQGSSFITFQRNAAIPTPLFYRTAKGGPSTPLSSKKKKCLTPKSESKKVTFGLKNNKTAEFRKNDRSLLVSPEGSSRVAFDPQQKPLFGVLKSPIGALKGSTKKKTPKGTPKSTPKERPTAADFF